MSEVKASKPRGWPGGVRMAGFLGPADAEAVVGGGGFEDLLEDLRRAAALVADGDAPATTLDRAEGWRHLAGLLRVGIAEMLVETDPDRPRFNWADGTGKWGLDCADAVYAQASVRGGNVYRVRGRRGSVHFLGFQLMARMRGADDLDADALEVASDGSFEFVLGGEERAHNWMALPDDATTLIARQFFYDWEREEPARFEIERIDDGPRREPAVVAPDAVAAQLRALGRFVHDNTGWWTEVAAAKRTQVNTFPDDGGGLGAVAAAAQKYQAFGIGYFSLAEDQVLLIEVTPPEARYWSLHLGNYWMESLDFANHQSSLNGHQAALDADGAFRALVSLRDPGVANWLDPAGHAEGAMIYRWNQAREAPIPQTRLLTFDELPAALPVGTARVTPPQRAAAIEARRQHIRRRYGRPV